MRDNLKYLRDYVYTVGDEPFEKVALSQVDMAIFSLLAYLPFESVVNDKILGKRVSEFPEYMEPFRHHNSIGLLYPVFDLVVLLSTCNRYKNLSLHNFEYKLNSNKQMQFFACTLVDNCVSCDEPLTIVAFRGTDVSIVGWKENFSMSYLDEIPSQNEAENYLISLPGNLQRFYLVGHSKGGYLAMHAAATYDDGQKIEGVYCFDSPSLWGKSRENSNWDEISKKIHCFAPFQTLISLTLGNSPDLNIIKSDGFSILQHNPFCWRIKDDKFDRSECLSKQSRIFYHMLHQAFENSTEDERELFFNTIFKFIGWLQVDSVEDIFGKTIVQPIASIKKISGFSHEEKQNLVKFIKLVVPKVKDLKAS